MAIDKEKNIRVQTIISKETKAQLEQLAKEDGRSISNYIARLIEEDIKQKALDN